MSWSQDRWPPHWKNKGKRDSVLPSSGKGGKVFLPLVEPDTEGNKERALVIAAQLYKHTYWKSAIQRNLHLENNCANHESYERRVIVKSLPLLFMCSGQNTQSGNTQATNSRTVTCVIKVRMTAWRQKQMMAAVALFSDPIASTVNTPSYG